MSWDFDSSVLSVCLLNQAMESRRYALVIERVELECAGFRHAMSKMNFEFAHLRGNKFTTTISILRQHDLRPQQRLTKHHVINFKVTGKAQKAFKNSLIFLSLPALLFRKRLSNARSRQMEMSAFTFCVSVFWWKSFLINGFGIDCHLWYNEEFMGTIPRRKSNLSQFPLPSSTNKLRPATPHTFSSPAKGNFYQYLTFHFRINDFIIIFVPALARDFAFTVCYRRAIVNVHLFGCCFRDEDEQKNLLKCHSSSMRF